MAVYTTHETAAFLGQPPAVRQPSLYLEKFCSLPASDQDKTSRQEFVHTVCGMAADEQGRLDRIRFVQHQAARLSGFVSFKARLMGRLIVNQAGGVVENAGLCLDRHSGVPYIPGTALKGLSHHAALQCVREMRANLHEVLAVFGWAPGPGNRGVADGLPKAFAGTVTFFSAWPACRAPLAPDITTCHYRGYYSQSDIALCLDNEEPVPNPFPAVEAGAEFLFSLATSGGSREWMRIRELLALPEGFDPAARARQWLQEALTDRGAGAKTAAGYGWFCLA